MKTIIFAAIALGISAAPAPAQTACLEVGRIWSFHPLDKTTLVVEDQLHRKFRVALAGYCPRLPFKLNLAIRSAAGVNGLDCVRRGDTVISADVGQHYSCAVTSVVPYTAAMEKADTAPQQGRR